MPTKNKDSTAATLKLDLSIPSVYVTSMYGWSLYDWQRDTMDSLAPKYACTALVSANGAGKTSRVVSGLIMWHMKMFPGSLTIYTSASNRQIKNQLFPTLRPLISKHHPNWTVKEGNEFSITDPETGSHCLCFSTDDPGLAEGYHFIGKEGTFIVDGKEHPYEKRLLIIMDEMKSIKPEIVDPLRVRCRHTNMLDVSSPSLSAAGDFYDDFHSNKEYFEHELTFPTQIQKGYNLFRAALKDCPHLKDDKPLYKRLMLDRKNKGENHPLILSSQDAMFPSSGERMVFNMKKVDDAMNGMIPRYGNSKRIAIDLSGGHDEIVLGYRIGNQAYIYWTSHETFAPTLVKELVEKCRFLMATHDIRKEEIFADQGGLGKPIIQQMEQKGLRGINFFDFGGKPNDPMSYKNARAEMAFELADRMAQDEIILPRDEELRSQFGIITYAESDDKETLKLTPKKDMIKSPDRVDVMKMLFYNMKRQEEEQQDTTDHDIRLSISRTKSHFGTYSEDEEFNYCTNDGLFF